MYHEERKARFIEESGRSVGYCKKFFQDAQPIEEEYGLDLAQLPSEAVRTLLLKQVRTRVIALNIATGFIREYYQWCSENGYEVGDGLSDLNIDLSEVVRRSMVSSPMHLAMVLDAMFDPLEKGSADCLYRCYCWLAFSGIPQGHIFDVRIGDMDFYHMIVCLDGHMYDMYRESVPTILDCCWKSHFLYENQNYTEKEMMRPRHKGDYLMRSIRADRITIRAVQNRLPRANARAGTDLNYTGLYLSGVFYRAYELERAGFQPDFASVALEKLTAEGKPIKRTTITSAVRAFLEDYENWKKAYG